MADAFLRRPEEQECLPMDIGDIEGQGEGQQRVAASYAARHSRFLVKNKTFTQQYSHIYTKRLLQMKPMLKRRVQSAWGHDVALSDHIIDVVEGKECVLIGTTFKEMSLRPSVLDEFTEDRAIQGSVKPMTSIVSDNDAIILEDDTGRVRLTGTVNVHTLVTGITVAVRGIINSAGQLEASGILYCDSLPQSVFPIPESVTYVMLVSGLEMGNASCEVYVQMLSDFVCGRLGGPQDVELARRVCRVILAGNNVCAPEIQHGNLNRKQQELIAAPIRKFDVALAQTLTSVTCDIMPGSNDPSTYTLPQQPLHACVLPHSTRFSSCVCVTNPYEAEIGGRIFLGTSGQNVNDIRCAALIFPIATPFLPYLRYETDFGSKHSLQTRFCTEQTLTPTESKGPRKGYCMCGGEACACSRTECTCSIKILERLLAWAHIAPTAPDTLPCYPFYYDDPFVIEDTPHVLFAGNQEAFSTTMRIGPEGQSTRLVCIPQFTKTHQAVLVELQSLDCFTIDFDAVVSAAMDTDRT